ncbi:transposase [Aureibacillus halotolerans]|uniref:IS4 family transposase n=1 Tax=Aureibacillus halotolerans TaxID=1508390 RepID=A0A4R6UC94_9BACI|nr:transposase [Aureibacillus halotolerans]TDQ40694.1 IS4 family transposase [Aureibacillus halotolerans]
MYILQDSLFTLQELLEMESNDRFSIFFKELDLRPYAAMLKSKSPQGAQGHSREAILRALLIAPLEGYFTFTALHRRLDSDISFRYRCGFSLEDKAPSISTLSRTFRQLTDQGLLDQLFNDLVQRCWDEGIIDGTTIAIDSTAIDAYEKKRPKSRCQQKDEASWGAKRDSFGNLLTWFGYKAHLAVDTASELPVAIEVTPAHITDGEIGPSLVEKAAQSVSFTYVTGDAGYDQKRNYEVVKAHGAQAIIPLNLRNEKEPPSGFSSIGTPRCSMGYDMTYWGTDGSHLKFRCPHATGHVECPHGTTWCSPSNYGMVKKVDVDQDVRRFSQPHRGTRHWNETYKQRSSVERVNSRMKDHLTSDDLHVRKLKKVTTYIILNAIVLLASSLAAKRTIAQNAA